MEFAESTEFEELVGPRGGAMYRALDSDVLYCLKRSTKKPNEINLICVSDDCLGTAFIKDDLLYPLDPHTISHGCDAGKKILREKRMECAFRHSLRKACGDAANSSLSDREIYSREIQP